MYLWGRDKWTNGVDLLSLESAGCWVRTVPSGVQWLLPAVLLQSREREKEREGERETLGVEKK